MWDGGVGGYERGRMWLLVGEYKRANVRGVCVGV